MEEETKRKFFGILLVAAGVVLLLVVLYLVFFMFNKKKEVSNDVPVSNTVTEVQPPKNVVNPVAVKNIKTVEVAYESEEKVTERDIKKMAASFAERFGSYSNQSNFGNISDLNIFMSAQMKKWAENFIKQQKEKQGDTEIYYGIVTKAITQETVNYDEDLGQAVVLVKTRRREATMTTSNTSKIFNQNILISMVKESGAWKINSATWQ